MLLHGPFVLAFLSVSKPNNCALGNAAPRTMEVSQELGDILSYSPFNLWPPMYARTDRSRKGASAPYHPVRIKKHVINKPV